jgi:hypothetical protein
MKPRVDQESVLGPIIYLIYKSDLPTTDNTTIATFADSTAILDTHEDPTIGSMKLQATVNKKNVWAKKCRIKTNQTRPRILHSAYATTPVRQ